MVVGIYNLWYNSYNTSHEAGVMNCWTNRFCACIAPWIGLESQESWSGEELHDSCVGSVRPQKEWQHPVCCSSNGCHAWLEWCFSPPKLKEMATRVAKSHCTSVLIAVPLMAVLASCGSKKRDDLIHKPNGPNPKRQCVCIHILFFFNISATLDCVLVARHTVFQLWLWTASFNV